MELIALIAQQERYLTIIMKNVQLVLLDIIQKRDQPPVINAQEEHILA